jgi:nitrate reductase beta subunit
MKLTFGDVEKMLGKFHILFPLHPLPDFSALTAIWHAALANAELGDVQRAYVSLLKTLHHFPVPADFIRQIFQDGGEV